METPYPAVTHAMALKRLPLTAWLAFIILRLPPFHDLDSSEILLLSFFVSLDLAYSQVFAFMGHEFRRTSRLETLRKATFWAALVFCYLTECILVVWYRLRTHESAWFDAMEPLWKTITLCLMPWLTMAAWAYACALLIRHPGPVLCFLFVSIVFLYCA